MSYAMQNVEEALSPASSLPPLPIILSTAEDDELLYKQLKQINGHKAGRIVILSFRALHIYRIAKLQVELIKKQNATMNPDSHAALTQDELHSFLPQPDKMVATHAYVEVANRTSRSQITGSRFSRYICILSKTL